jgi:hypothetical protein
MNQRMRDHVLNENYELAKRNLRRAYATICNLDDPELIGRARALALDAVEVLEIILGFRDENGFRIPESPMDPEIQKQIDEWTRYYASLHPKPPKKELFS